ncbi:MAG: indole-3-glycerol phosphate synthase TrpC [Alphaproteobacteria bacterium]|nr:indole-3-glycerol phosphate synthase TrpC [Alphaproteobacteria bacterium]
MTLTTTIDSPLQQICAATAARLQRQQQSVPMARLWQQALASPLPRDFLAALNPGRLTHPTPKPTVIAEMKRASPSAGVIRNPFDPVAIAHGYHQAGAAALSILTEPDWFHGHAKDIGRVRQSCPLPILRKDFTLSPYHVAEARLMGADAVLLIVAILSEPLIQECMDAASQLGLTALVEVHDGDELATALRLGVKLIGVNNRNLKTLITNLDTTLTLVPMIPDDVTVVAESGLKTADDLMACQRLGVNNFLIGEHFMRQSDPGVALSALLSAVAPC